MPTLGNGGRPRSDGTICRSEGTTVWVNTAIAWPDLTTAVNPATLPLA